MHDEVFWERASNYSGIWANWSDGWFTVGCIWRALSHTAKNAAPLDIPRAIVLDDVGLRTLQVFGADKAYLDLTVEDDGCSPIREAAKIPMLVSTYE